MNSVTLEREEMEIIDLIYCFHFKILSPFCHDLWVRLFLNTQNSRNVQCMWTWKVKVLQKGCWDLETNSYVHIRQIIEGELKTKQNKTQMASNFTAFV